MEVKIGVVYSPRELTVEVDGSGDDVVAGIESSLAAGPTSVLWLSDKKGRRIGVPVEKIAYVEVGVEDAAKRIGFGPG